MHKFLWVIVLLTCQISYGQTLNHEYIDGFDLNSPKHKVVEVTARLAKNYIRSDINNIQKKLLHNKALKFKKKSLPNLLDLIEQDVQKILLEADDWSETAINTKYLLDISRVLGRELKIPGFQKANTGGMGDAIVRLKFKGDSISHFQVFANTTVDYSTFSGFEYSLEALKDMEQLYRQKFGNFSDRNGSIESNVCSQDSHPIFYELYEIQQEQFKGVFTHIYGFRIRKTGKKSCEVIGNHLTEIEINIERTS